MNRYVLFIVCASLLIGIAACGSQREMTSPPATSSIDTSNLYFVAAYDPNRDPFADQAAAIEQAKQSGRYVLLEIGGDWCVWCHILEDYIASNEDIATAMQANFVIVKVNVSEENQNDAFMAQYPQVAGYPHFYILDDEGKLLQSQNTGELEQGDSYNHDVFLSFVNKWSPKKPSE